MKEMKTVALIGLGAMGSFFAVKLYEELGDDFHIVAGGKRAERLKHDGVTINGETYRFPVLNPEQEHDAVDLVICAVKAYSLDTALADVAGIVGSDTQILAVQNGVESESRAIAVYGERRVLYSYMKVSVVMKNGATKYDPDKGAVFFGEKHNEAPYSPRVQAVKALFDRCGIGYRIDADMVRSIWFKYMCNIGENMTCVLLGVPFGAFRSNDDANYIRKNAMREVIAIAQAKGIDLGEADIEAQEKTVHSIIPAKNKPSTLQDIENGRHTEIELFAGTVCRMGKDLGIPTPINEVFYHGIKVYEAKMDGAIEGL